MLRQLLPQLADNTYRGHALALWVLGLLVLMKVALGVNSIFNGRSVAATADGIPLGAFPPDAARAVVTLFALLGLGQLLLGLGGLLVLVRYRGLVPLAFLVLLLEHLARRLILQVLPIARTGGASGVVVNLVFFGLMAAGLALSLWSRGEGRVRP